MKESMAVIDADGRILKRVDAVLPIYSITKTMIASILLDLEIDLESRISKWIPEAVCRHAGRIRVRHLLNHASGIKDYGGLAEYQRDVEARRPPWPDEKFGELTLHQELLFEPGQGFFYSNPNYWLLKRLLETESGRSFDELIQTQIAGPLGLSSLRVAHGVFDEALPGYEAGWVWHGLVLANAVETAMFMRSDRVTRLNTHLNPVPGDKDVNWKHPHYGLGLMVDLGVKYGHLGGGPGYESACLRFLDSGLCICAILPTGKGVNPLRYVLSEMESITRNENPLK